MADIWIKGRCIWRNIPMPTLQRLLEERKWIEPGTGQVSKRSRGYSSPYKLREGVTTRAFWTRVQELAKELYK